LGAQGTAWDRAAAARYLDARMDIWFTSAKQLRTGDGTSPCASCHTSVPYALARPALRHALRDATPTAQETRLAAEATKRVVTYATHQPAYDNNYRKTVEARGTESVLNALILARSESGSNSDAVRHAFARLWETQRGDGAWEWLEFGLEPFETVDGGYQGAALAALAVGLGRSTVGPDSGSIRAAAAGEAKLRGYLHANFASQRLFNRTWALVANSQLTGLLSTKERDTLVAELSRAQRKDGGWSLQSLGSWRWSKAESPWAPPGTVDTVLVAQSDGYATGLVVYALKLAGLAESNATVQRGVDWLVKNQRDVQVGEQSISAWRTYSLNFDREHGGPRGEPVRRLFMSDLATAFAVLALTEPSAK
jgi:squalene-hopene/tetraprenyl-beta-curcumene cyclase